MDNSVTNTGKICNFPLYPSFKVLNKSVKSIFIYIKELHKCYLRNTCTFLTFLRLQSSPEELANAWNQDLEENKMYFIEKLLVKADELVLKRVSVCALWKLYAPPFTAA